jgi:hypothetical protein
LVVDVVIDGVMHGNAVGKSCFAAYINGIVPHLVAVEAVRFPVIHAVDLVVIPAGAENIMVFCQMAFPTPVAFDCISGKWAVVGDVAQLVALAALSEQGPGDPFYKGDWLAEHHQVSLLHFLGGGTILVNECKRNGGCISCDELWLPDPGQGQDKVKPGTYWVANNFFEKLVVCVHCVIVQVRDRGPMEDDPGPASTWCQNSIWERLQQNVCDLGDFGKQNISSKGVDIVVWVDGPPP